jgi:hypothetical protein
MMALTSDDFFVLHYPSHTVTQQYRQLIAKLLS